jgi:hypothetical protein
MVVGELPVLRRSHSTNKDLLVPFQLPVNQPSSGQLQQDNTQRLPWNKARTSLC